MAICPRRSLLAQWLLREAAAMHSPPSLSISMRLAPNVAFFCFQMNISNVSLQVYDDAEPRGAVYSRHCCSALLSGHKHPSRAWLCSGRRNAAVAQVFLKPSTASMLEHSFAHRHSGTIRPAKFTRKQGCRLSSTALFRLHADAVVACYHRA